MICTAYTGEVKGLMYGVLGRGPRSIEEFKIIAMDEGMNVIMD